MDEYKQYYYSARPSAQGKAYGRSVAPRTSFRFLKACVSRSASLCCSDSFYCSQRC